MWQVLARVHKRFRVFGKAASTYRREMKVAGRLAGKIVIVTDYKEYAGADIVKLFREEDGEVFAVDRDLTIPSAADDLIREVGHVDILVANLAYPHKYAPAHQKRTRTWSMRCSDCSTRCIG
jgi:NAD(P)-dependent dehydrogenase (short-subunit alcohol dehydrogenase family)